MVPRVRPLIDIGYKYNERKVLSFIVTENAGITNTGIPYLSKYPDKFTNVAIRPVACPLVMLKKICCEWGWLPQQVNTVWFGTVEVVGYSMWLATAMYNSWYGNDYY